MIRLAWIGCALALTACGNKDASGDTSSSDDGVPGCEVEDVEVTYPASSGATDFYYRAAVEFEFDGSDDDATIILTDAAGAAVDGTVAWDDDGDVLSFQPTAALAPSTDYSATVSSCKGTGSPILFRTSDLGGALENGPEGLVGNTYVVALDGARFVKPAGVGSLLLDLLEQDILLGVLAASETEIEMIGAISKTDSTDQDTCNESIDFGVAADFTDAPHFSIGPQDTTLSAAGVGVTIRQLNVSGDFSADGSYFGGGVLSGEIDARDLVGILIDNNLIEDDDPQTVCDLVAGFGVPCEACNSDGEILCLSVYVDQITADSDDQTLVPLEECDPNTCEGGCDPVAE